MHTIPSVKIEELYTELFTPLFRYFFFRTKDYELAEDLTQSTFLKFLNQETKPTDKDHSLKLLFTIARTTLIDYYRVHTKRVSLSIESLDLDIPSETPNPEQVFKRTEDIAIVQDALHTLSDREQDIVTLRMTTDMGYQAIGESLALTSSAVRQIHGRALKKIKAYVDAKGHTQ